MHGGVELVVRIDERLVVVVRVGLVLAGWRRVDELRGRGVVAVDGGRFGAKWLLYRFVVGAVRWEEVGRL